MRKDSLEQLIVSNDASTAKIHWQVALVKLRVQAVACILSLHKKDTSLDKVMLLICFDRH